MDETGTIILVNSLFLTETISKEKCSLMGRKSSQKHAQHSALTVELCPQCQAFVGRNYPQCLHCREVAEQQIKASWQALLRVQNIAPGTPPERELAATILADSDHYWWSEVEAAMRLT